MMNISKKLENAVGFSNGKAELTLKNPPPLVPSSLIASCEATGPRAMPPTLPPSVCRTPWETSTTVAMTDSGTRM